MFGNFAFCKNARKPPVQRPQNITNIYTCMHIIHIHTYIYTCRHLQTHTYIYVVWHILFWMTILGSNYEKTQGMCGEITENAGKGMNTQEICRKFNTHPGNSLGFLEHRWHIDVFWENWFRFLQKRRTFVSTSSTPCNNRTWPPSWGALRHGRPSRGRSSRNTTPHVLRYVW